MGNYVIQSTDDPPFVTCRDCDGRGYITALKWGVDPDWCPACGGAKEIALDMMRLATLAHNLYAASCLVRAFHDGVRYEFAQDHHAPWIDGRWVPGCGRGHDDEGDDECPCEEAVT